MNAERIFIALGIVPAPNETHFQLTLRRLALLCGVAAVVINVLPVTLL